VSVQQALLFIAASRKRPELGDAIRRLAPDVSVEQLAEIGRAGGFDFTADELRLAHRHDWTMRQARYSPPSE
jgi:hypothetical protein